MLSLVLIGLVLTGVACALLARAFAMPRIRAAERLREIGTYGFPAVATAEGPLVAGGGPGHDGAMSALGRAVTRRLPAVQPQDLQKQLLRAGLYTMTPERFTGYRVAAGVGFPLFWLWLMSAGASGGLAVLGMALGVVGGWVLPLTVLRRRGEQRLQQIEYELPELVDILVVTVEAGLGFSGSLQRAAGQLTGPLGDELSLAHQQQRMGLSTNEALEELLDRCDTPSMRSFVRSVLQGETLGVSIGDIMRNLADEMRKRRRHAAEERAQKAPVKLLFPLVFLIFPAMFVVILYPGLVAIFDTLSQGV